MITPTPEQAALLTVLMIAAFDEERGRATTRARISAKSVRKVAFRPLLQESFIQDWTLSLARLGWAAFPVGDAYGLIKTASIEGWSRIASTRIDDALQRVREGDPTIFGEIEATIAIEDADRDED